MKNFKFIPVLAIAALLSACGVNKSASIKAPKFAKQGAEVSYTEFMNKLNEAFDASEINQKDAKLSDRLITSKQSQTQKEVVKNGKKQVSKQEQVITFESKYQFDYDNCIGKAEDVFKASSASEDAHGDKTTEDSEKETSQLQFGEGEHENQFYEYELENKYYRQVATLAEDETKEHLFGTLIKETIYDSISMAMGILPSSEAEAESYKFYVNGKVFTYTDGYDESGDMKDDDDNVFGTYTAKGDLKVQIDLTDGAQKLKVAMDVTETGKYTAAYANYGEGDESKTEVKMYVDNSVQSKKVSLKAIDASEFVPNPII